MINIFGLRQSSDSDETGGYEEKPSNLLKSDDTLSAGTAK